MLSSILIAGLGTPELIVIFFAFMFFIGMIFVIIFVIRMIFKKDTVPNFPPPSQHYHVNVGHQDKEQPAEPDLKKKIISDLIETDKIALPQQSEIRYANISEIIRCESDDNYTNFILMNERVLVSRSLKEYADLLKPKGFLRTHQSHLVNPKYVRSWLKEDGGILLLTNGDKIPVSKANREQIKEALS